MDTDGHGIIYISDPKKNSVHQMLRYSSEYGTLV